MTFPLTQNETDSYFDALKLLKSPYFNEKEELCSYNDLKMLVKNFNKCNNFLHPEKIKTECLLGNKARNILKNILQKIKQKMVDVTIETSEKKQNKNKKRTHEANNRMQQLQRLKAVIHLQLGRILWRTGDMKEGQKEISRCWLIIEKDDIEGVTSQVKQVVLIEFGLMSYKQGNLKKSLKYFEESVKVYKKPKKNFSAWCVDDFFRAEAYDPQFKDDQKRQFVLSRNIVETFYNLTLINLKLEINNDASLCFFGILTIQLQSQSYNALEWSNLAIELSLYFNCLEKLIVSRHCLAAAETVLKQEGDCPSNLFVKLSEGLSEEEKEEKVRVSKMWAKLYLHWAKYCQTFLLVDPLVSIDSSLAGFVFPLDVTECESQINASSLVSFEDAKAVFLQGQAWLKRSKEFYNLQSFSSEYVELVLLNGDLFKCLFKHEPDKSRKSKMLKRRIDILTELLSQLNKNEFISLHMRVCFHLTDAYFLLANQKYSISFTPNTIRNSRADDKIISLTLKTIDFARSFIEYHKGPEGQLPENLDLKHCIINSHYILACSFHMMSTMVPNSILEIHESIKNHKYVVDYYRKNPPTTPQQVSMEKKSKDDIDGISTSLSIPFLDIY